MRPYEPIFHFHSRVSPGEVVQQLLSGPLLITSWMCMFRPQLLVVQAVLFCLMTSRATQAGAVSPHGPPRGLPRSCRWL